MSDTIVSRCLELALADPRRICFRVQIAREPVPTFADITRGEFAAGILLLRDRLVQAGVRNGDRVLVSLPNGLAWAALDLACQALGAVSVVVHPAVSEEVVKRIASDTCPRVVVTRKTTASWPAGVSSLDADEIEALVPRGQGEIAIEWPAGIPECGPRDLATVMYTSGTTGEPKGAMLSHAGLFANASATAEALGIVPHDRIPALLSFSHSAGRMALLHVALVAGASVSILDRIDVATDLAAVGKTRPTVLVAVPRVIERLLADATPSDVAFESIRLALIGGASLSAPIAKELERRGVSVCEAYGSTEATCTVTLNRPNARRRGSVGPPLPGVELRIAPDGEVLCRGPNVMLGFWADPFTTAGVLDPEGWLRTGDLGSLDADGFLKIVGRKKDVFLAADGNHFAPARLEALLESVPGIAEAIVAGGDGRPFVSALVVPDFARFRGAAVEPHASCPRAPVCTRTDADLAGCHRLARRLQEAVDANVNCTLSSAERVRTVRLMGERFPAAVRSLTPTAKVKVDRRRFGECYAAIIEDIYPQQLSDLSAARATFQVPAEGLLREVARFHADWTRETGIAGGDSLQSAPNVLLDGTGFPEEGVEASEVLKRFESLVAGGSVRLGRTSFAGHMVSALPTIGIAAEALMAVLNQNQVSADASPATTVLERETVRWLADLMGYDPQSASGIGAAGGSIANITALLAARNWTLPRSRSSGLEGGDGGVIVVSRRMHYSFRRAAELMGLGGERGLVQVPVDSTNRVRLDELLRILDELDRARRPVIALVAIAGTSETGNVDPISRMADIAEERGIWLHVDAAMGAAALASPRQRTRFAGIERAQSITVDPHKWFYVPYQCAYVLFRDSSLMNKLELCDPHFVVLRDEDPDLGKWSIEGSRAANALKFWMVAQAIGRRGYAALVERQIDLNLELASLVDRSTDLQRLSVPELNILCFRFAPARCRELLESLGPDGEHPCQVNAWLDRINIKIQERLARAHGTFLSRTTLQSPVSGIPVVALRAVLFNPHLELCDLERIVRQVELMGWDISEEQPAQNRQSATFPGVIPCAIRHCRSSAS